MNTEASIVILVTRNGMGEGDQELQTQLIEKYFQLMLAGGLMPRVICFYADGVKLVVKGSPLLDVLQKLEDKGIHLVVCSTCLNFYGLQADLQVGIVGGMSDIIEAQWLADKVITI